MQPLRRLPERRLKNKRCETATPLAISSGFYSIYWSGFPTFAIPRLGGYGEMLLDRQQQPGRTETDGQAQRTPRKSAPRLQFMVLLAIASWAVIIVAAIAVYFAFGRG